MPAALADKLGDISQVLALHNALHRSEVAKTPRHEEQRSDQEHHDEDFIRSSSPRGLGDFSKLYRVLGTSTASTLSSLEVKGPEDTKAEPYSYPMKDDYASDGAMYSKLPSGRSKAVQFEEQTSPEEQGTTDAYSEGSVEPDTPSLTKSQRKKRNRRERKRLEAEAAAKRAHVSESEAEIVKRQAPARKASSHVISTPPSSRYSLRARDASGNAITSMDGPSEEAVNLAKQKLSAAKNAVSHSRPQEAPTSTPVLTSVPQRGASTHIKGISDPFNQRQQSHLPSTPSNGATRFLPATVQPRTNPAPARTIHQQHATPMHLPNNHGNPSTVPPMTIRTGKDRHYALLMKLIRDFYAEDGEYLISPMNLTNHNNNPKGIHVFVDASNIFIGFKDQLRQSRGIAHLPRIPNPSISFDALALLMERRRPVAKRVLAGSTPRLPAFDKAEAVGYECNILDKVWKAKELTPRQEYFKEVDRIRFGKRSKPPPVNNVATLNGRIGSGNGSESETNTPQYAPARNVEQGVDEILHMKMCESIIDADEPGTMVLATGDAAIAEYSQGFMAQAERALLKGWKVELVSWSANISAAYNKRQWTEAWGDRFKIILLDDYVEELLDI